MHSFTIKDLENLSGIKAHTIRIWEKRYSFLKPSRTGTNIRFYSNEELKKILNVALLNKYGFKISHIDRMNEGEMKEKILSLNHLEAQQERMVNTLIQNMVDLNMESFEEILENFISARGVERTITQIIFPFLEKIGILWMTNHINPAADTVSNCLVNESFAETFLDKTRDPIGQTVGRNTQKGVVEMYVVGIVKNYHSSSFKEKIEPMYFSLDKRSSAFNTFIKYAPGLGKPALAGISKTFKALLPFSTMNYQFMQDWNESWYSEDARWKEIVFYAAIIAIMLSCLGLFALSPLSIQQRVKEICIRKVLGASVISITKLVSADFLKLVFISLLIASPVAWWLMNGWLKDFAYRISISWWIFVLSGIIALLIEKI